MPLIEKDILPDRPRVGSTRLASTGGFVLGAGSGPVLRASVKEYNSLPWKARAAHLLKSFKSKLKMFLLYTDVDHDVLNFLLSINNDNSVNNMNFEFLKL